MTQMKNPVIREGVSRRFKRILKTGRILTGRSQGKAQPVFVMGYGRSGTTMLLDTFEHDMRIDVFGENDPRVAEDHMLVRSHVGQVISGSRARVIVMKPILDSFSVCDLMREHPTALVIWALRALDPVVISALKKFGTSVADELRDLVVGNQGGGWLKRGIAPTTLSHLRQLDTSQYGPNEWMALVWWAVNRTLLSRELVANNRLLLVRYEELICDPDQWMRTIYRFIGLPFRLGSTKWVEPQATSRPVEVAIRQDVRRLCADLSRDIDRQFGLETNEKATKRSAG